MRPGAVNMDYSKPLPNQRHEKVVLGLLEGKTDGKAYEDAGYKAHRGNAGRMSADEHILGRLAFLQSQVAEEAVIDAAWVTKRLVEIVDRAMQAIEVTDAKGDVTGEYTFQGSVANKALELLGRNIGMFKDAPPVQVHVNGIVADAAERAARFDAALAEEEQKIH